MSINHLYILHKIFLASGPMRETMVLNRAIIETMVQWKAWIAFGDSTLSSTICYCLNFQQGLKRDENPRPKLISTKDITGKTKISHWVYVMMPLKITIYFQA